MNRVDFARKLRKDQTKAEALFWHEVRNRLFYDLKFKRQVPIGRYIVDFCCEAEMLVVELDGDQHATDENREYDVQRSVYLEDQGYRVLRYWNNEIFENIEGVFAYIERCIGVT